MRKTNLGNNAMPERYILLIITLFVALLLSAQQSCYEQYLLEHDMPLPADNVIENDNSYDELKKEVIARQLMRDEAEKARHATEYYQIPSEAQIEPTYQPIFLAIDTITGTCHLLAEDGTILADAHLALVDSTWYMWLSVDPLADKNISSSPYMYCNGNPIMLVDQDGRDTLFVNSSGQVKNYTISKTGNDVINMVKADGSTYASYSMPSGTMNLIEETTDDKGRYTFVMCITGDTYGDGAYKFIADNMSGTIEWTLVQTGNITDGKNYIGTNNTRGCNSVQSHIIRSQKIAADYIRHASHTHPSNPEYTKGVDDKAATNLRYGPNTSNKFAPNAVFTIYAVPYHTYINIPYLSRP